jgi:4-hydroxybenzoate polyprenyltransferase
MLALSLCYVAGMFLNDAFDREFDARHRRERPIPSGRASAAEVFGAGFGMLAVGILLLGWLGLGVEGGTGGRPLVTGLLLAATILAYDWRHKQNPLSPVVMGLCRLLVYVVAACAVIAEPPGRVFLAGLLLLSYLVGLTYIARQEHLDRLGHWWPLAFLALPLLWGAQAAVGSLPVAVLWLLFAAWVLYALSFVKRRRPGDVPRAVGGLLAGICLWDALVIAATGQPGLAAVAVAGFALTLLLQRFVAPT